MKANLVANAIVSLLLFVVVVVVVAAKATTESQNSQQQQPYLNSIMVSTTTDVGIFEYDVIDPEQTTGPSAKTLIKYGSASRLNGPILPNVCTIDIYTNLLYTVSRNQTSTSKGTTSSSQYSYTIHTIDALNGELRNSMVVLKQGMLNGAHLTSIEFDQVQSILLGVLWQFNIQDMTTESTLVQIDLNSGSGEITPIVTVPDSIPVRGVSAYCDKKSIYYIYIKSIAASSSSAAGVGQWVKLDASNGVILARNTVPYEITSMEVLAGVLYATTIDNHNNNRTELVQLDRSNGQISRVLISPFLNMLSGSYMDIDSGIYYLGVKTNNGSSGSGIASVNVQTGKYTVTDDLKKVPLCLVKTRKQ